ncbi:MAG: hypothetical protein M3355_02805, partial [Actinomycetota bacterium]|nr:hypothetical protein [Actinomycetota bacterium]
MSWGRRLVGIALRALAGCVLAFFALVALVSLADIENNSTGDKIAEWIYSAIWVLAGLSFVALVIGGLTTMRGPARFILVGLLTLVLAFFVSRLISPPSDALQVEDVLETVSTTSDPSVCEELMTSAYLEQVTGLSAPFSDEFCEQTISSRDAAADVEVMDIEVGEEEATALVSYSGGPLDGSRVAVALVEDDGDWKIDRRLRFQTLDRPAFEDALRDQLDDPE